MRTLFDEPPKCENCADTGWVRNPGGDGGRGRGGHFCQVCRTQQGESGMHAVGDVVAEVARSLESSLQAAPAAAAAQQAEACTLNAHHIPWTELDTDEAAVVTLISQADREHPVRIAEIQQQTGLSDRSVKAIVHTLRETHLLPIGGSRKPPVGMFWIRDAEGFQSYWDQTHAQAMSELRTLYKMARAHYPQLAGQMKLVMNDE